MSSTPPSPDHPALEPEERESISLGELQEDRINVRVLRSGRRVIVLRRGAEVHAFGDICPHMGADMAEATYCAKDGTLQCRWHGYFFGADDGRFLRNPNEDFMQMLRVPSQHFDPTKTPRYRLTVVPTSRKDGRLYFGRDEEPRPEPSATEEGHP
jgi:nitrite reductase (NADH) small subunit/3-phenylpropionate/trans-cinnamate dioxygenase ferredoxin subunit